MSSEGDELNWLATQYVLGELACADRDSFELRLTNDLAACEAVASAHLLLATVQSAISSSVAVRPAAILSHESPKKSHWAVIASTVVALSLVGSSFWFSVPTSDSGMSDVSMWSLDDDVTVAEMGESDEDNDSHLEIPEWLLAGVSLELHDARKDN
ncbi:hypothetical protein [Schlesneria paludicola]|uniref:hypothetical protein n=1 Tax=Schlesneria paludicola TaxID=360056 RepID=UPI00029B5303|nr:hypothetical protein [Schlesneria paludicola]